MAKNKPAIQPVAMAQPVQLQQAAIKTETFGKVSNVQLQPSKASQALSTLNRLIPEAATLAASQLNEIAEEDKTRQTARALNGMEPSEDATKTGRIAAGTTDRTTPKVSYCRRGLPSSPTARSASAWRR